MSAAQVGSAGAGVAITLLGGVLLAQGEGLGLEGGWLLAVVTALAGAALLASGFGARER